MTNQNEALGVSGNSSTAASRVDFDILRRAIASYNFTMGIEVVKPNRNAELAELRDDARLHLAIARVVERDAISEIHDRRDRLALETAERLINYPGATPRDIRLAVRTLEAINRRLDARQARQMEAALKLIHLPPATTGSVHVAVGRCERAPTPHNGESGTAITLLEAFRRRRIEREAAIQGNS